MLLPQAGAFAVPESSSCLPPASGRNFPGSRIRLRPASCLRQELDATLAKGDADVELLRLKELKELDLSGNPALDAVAYIGEAVARDAECVLSIAEPGRHLGRQQLVDAGLAPRELLALQHVLHLRHTAYG